MNTRISQTCSLDTNGQQYLYNIIGEIKVSIREVNNPFGLPFDVLFGMAARMNKKRGFLFVSKILGKHIPANPYVALLSGMLLGLLYIKQTGINTDFELDPWVEGLSKPDKAKALYEKLKRNPLILEEPTLFIGFAETATALGHSMYDIFQGPTFYLHTTREKIVGMDPLIHFEEEHSHATSHLCYATQEAFFQHPKCIILVDDEITTGKTCINIIRELHQSYPKSRYVVASLLDWRSDLNRSDFRQLEDELGISIRCLSLLSGEITVQGEPIHRGITNYRNCEEYNIVLSERSIGQFFQHRAYASINSQAQINQAPYLALTGRFGLVSSENEILDQMIRQAANELRKLRTGVKVLCMGAGEFMFIPMRIAAEMGDNVFYQTTTRSPIYSSDLADYAVRRSYQFPAPGNPDIVNYIYNIEPGQYDQLFFFMERKVPGGLPDQLLEVFRQLRILDIQVIYFD